MKKAFLFLFLILAVVVSAGEKLPKYIILFIGDGMSYPQRMIAEEYSVKMGTGKLAMNHLPFHATTRTSSANSIVTDSAASGTAIACGAKTNNGMIGVDPAGKKLQSVAELARDKQWKVGIISTMVINHATPASFFGHRRSRNQYYDLGLDLIASNFDLFAGGGIRQTQKNSPKRADLYELARKNGYKTLTEKKEYMALKPGCGKVIYAAAPSYMTADIDTPAGGPTLTDLTVKALELLKNPKGFFLMVEGGAIDSFGHANGAKGNIGETLALDKAVKAALEFQKKNPEETLIVVTADHETGGMTLGVKGHGFSPENLAAQKISANRFNTIMRELHQQNPKLPFAEAQKLLTQYFGLKFTGELKKDPLVVTKTQLQLLEEGFNKKKLADAVRVVMSQKAGIGWTTYSHTGVPVLTCATGVQAQQFSGFIENTEISKKLKAMIR